jgi:hypothetical protein
VEIDERVREAHLSHFCPGGAGFPVTTSRPIGLDLEEAAPPPALDSTLSGAAGRECGRCGCVILAGQDTRRRVSGAWVHETCPA